jgi:hypothetical protein
VISDRRYLAAQIEELSKSLHALNGWLENPNQQFPGDSVALAEQLHKVAQLLLADDTSGGLAG